MVVRKLPVVLALIILTPLLVFPDLLNTVRITGNISLLHGEEPDWSTVSYGTTRLDLIARGNANMKGQLQLDALISDVAIIDVPRAYMKIRFPWFRLTVGKTRITWGEGFLFNAGDVLFEGIYPLANLSASELRLATDWMIVPYIPLGPFSFIEGVILPHPSITPVELSSIDRGIRAVTELGDIKLEGGLLYKGIEEKYYPFLSFKGNLLTVDWHLSGSLAIPDEEPSGDEVKENSVMSFGLLRLVNLPYRGSLSFRLEGGLRPFGEWEEVEETRDQQTADPPANGDGAAAPFSVIPDYGLFLFPEVSYAPADNLSLQLRSLISPVDGSSLFMLGVSWNPFQGFTLSFFNQFMAGEEDDIFGWDRQGDAAFHAVFEYVYGSLN